MSDFIVHIGFHKTGTTTLQKNVFPFASGYLGKSDRTSETNIFKSIITSIENGKQTNSDLLNWLNRQKILCRNVQNIGDSTNIILSDEALCNLFFGVKRDKYPYIVGFNEQTKNKKIQISDFPIFDMVDYLNKNWDLGNVKVLMTIRSQPFYFASRYAQLSNKIINSCQQDFEKQLDEIIKYRHEFANWYSWVVKFIEKLGINNVCVLPLEAINTEAYWDKIRKFTNINIDFKYDSIGEIVLNQRKVSNTDSWNLRDVSRSLLRYETKMVMDDISLISLMNYFKGIIRLLLKKKLLNQSYQESHKIFLTDKVKNKILDSYKYSNTDLDNKLKLNLGLYGYY